MTFIASAPKRRTIVNLLNRSRAVLTGFLCLTFISALYLHPSVAQATTPFVSDSFTGASGSALTSHTGETGAAWTTPSGSGSGTSLYNNRLVGSGNATSAALASGGAPSADYTVEADVVAVGNTANYPALILRGDSTTGNKYAAIINAGSSVVQFNKGSGGGGEISGGTKTPVSFSTGVTYHFQAEVVGSTLKAYINGALVSTYSDTTITAPGKAGVQFYGGNGTDTSGFYIDNFSAQGETVAPSLSLAGSSTGIRNKASAFTVVAGGSIAGTVVVTPSDGGAGGTFSPASLSLSSAAPSATFTYTSAATGVRTISISNNGSIANPPSIAHTVQNATTIVSDTFSGSTGINLSAHTGEVGAAWTKHPLFPSGSLVITGGNKLRGNAAGSSIYYPSGTPTGSGYDVEADFYAASTSTTYPNLLGRLSSTTSSYYNFVYNFGTSQWEIDKYVNGSGPTVLSASAPTTLVAGQTYAIRFEVRDGQKAGYVNGSLVTATSDNSIATGLPGVQIYGSSTDSTGFQIDNFQVSEPQAAPDTSIPVAADNPALFYSPYNWIEGGSGASSYRTTPNPGAYVKFKATGSGAVKLKIDPSLYTGLSLAASDFPYIAVDVNGTKSFQQLQAGVSEYTIATLSGETTIMVYLRGVRLSTTAINRWNTPSNSLYGLKVTGLKLPADATLSSAPIHSKRMIVFGDSITEGAEAVGSGNNASDQDGSIVWGQQIAASLDAEVGIVGWSYAGWTAVGAGNVPRFGAPGNSWQSIASGVPRSFAAAPDYVIVNHGQNDGSANTQSLIYDSATDTGWIKDIRAAVGANSVIFMVRPYTTTNHPYMRDATAAYKAAHPSDARISFQDITDIYTQGSIHPTAAQHTEIASKLTPRLTAFLDTINPLLPGTVTVVSTGQHSISLTAGNASGGITPYTYQWHRATQSGFTPSSATRVNNATSLGLSDSGLNSGSAYYYRLQYTGSTGGSVYSQEVSATTTLAPSPSPTPSVSSSPTTTPTAVATPIPSINPASYALQILGINGSPVPSAGVTITSSRPTFSGMAPAGSQVTVTVHSDPVRCSALAGSNGNWSCTLASDLPAGRHSVDITAVTPSGQMVSLASFPMDVAPTLAKTGDATKSVTLIGLVLLFAAGGELTRRRLVKTNAR